MTRCCIEKTSSMKILTTLLGDIFYRNIIISDKKSLSLYPVLCNNV